MSEKLIQFLIESHKKIATETREKWAKRLETQYKKIKLKLKQDKIRRKLKKEDPINLSIKELQILLAFEYLKDGAEPDFVNQVWQGKDSMSKNKVDLLKSLTNFDY